jgi:hypothetical protein
VKLIKIIKVHPALYEKSEYEDKIFIARIHKDGLLTIYEPIDFISKKHPDWVIVSVLEYEIYKNPESI